jgi:hypothetical protein
MKKNFSVERLPCVMTKDERLEDAERLASTRRQIHTIQSAHEEVVSSFKARMKQYESEFDSLCEELRTGEKFKDIKVEAKVNEKLVKMEFFRTDTLEMIRTRDLTDEERQLVMPVVDKMKKAKEDKVAPADVAAPPEETPPADEQFPPNDEEAEK